MISVIMPAYNSEKYIAEAINSILKQSYKDFELIIINDGSSDDTLDIINEYAIKDERIVVISQENGGVASALNKGIELARGEYIARMDADDVAFEQRLEKQKKFLDLNNNIDICGTWAKTNYGEILKEPENDIDIKIQMFMYCSFIHPTVMVRKSFFDKYSIKYNLVKAEDYDLWVRCIDRAHFANIPQPLLMYRQHDNNVTVKDGSEFIKDDLRIKREYAKKVGCEEMIPQKHFFDNLFSVEDLDDYTDVLNCMLEYYGVEILPNSTMKTLMIICSNLGMSVYSASEIYRRLCDKLNVNISIRWYVYMIIKFIFKRLKFLK